ncbi:MAG TPA: glycine--tRNA ligase subunit beta [Nitrospiria bacterium]|nr:glycine--tRNA ligase subunit beta [Nitrospiria bacterium]
MKELIFEIGAEEIPSNLLSYGIKRLEEFARKYFADNRIEHEGLKTYGTPRRLILHVQRLADRQSERVEEVQGPPKKISFDPEGKPTQAAVKFAESQGVPLSELGFRTTPKGEYLTAVRRLPREKTDKILKTGLLLIIQSINFPKSMVWGPSRVRFVRPVRWIAAVYGGKPVAVSFGEVKSRPVSRGHRFLSPAPFPVKTFSAFEKDLRKKFVLIDPEEREKIIRKEAVRLEKGCGGSVLLQDDVLEQAVQMVEFPVVFRGDFDTEYLGLPKEVIINAMVEHQGYFPVFDPSGERLLPHFIAVSNMKVSNMGLIRKGNERVLRSRLADARFYFDSDLKVGLDERVGQLKKTVYQEELGTQYERVERLSLLSAEIGTMLGLPSPEIDQARRAGLLSKADLVAGVVREFPKVQGIMGGEYARRQGEPEEIAIALSEQYLPRFHGDRLPGTTLGRILSVAEKIDAIAGAFGVGLIPSGSEDPYGLRRQATGLIQTALLFSRPFSVRAMTEQAILLYGERLKRKPLTDVVEFLRQRFEFIVSSQGFRPDMIDAVVSGEFDDPSVCLKKIEALARFGEEPFFNSLMISFKRMGNIIPRGFGNAPVDQGKFKAPEEKSLFDALLEKEKETVRHYNEGRYDQALKALSDLRGSIDLFFNRVRVMEDDAEVRNNRAALLYRGVALFRTYAEFSKIVTEG